jgi:hypothetical protein
VGYIKRFITFIKESDTSHAFSLEEKLTKHLKKHGAMDKTAKAAGSTGGHDFHILHPKSKEKVGGTIRKTIHGETKKSISGAKLGSVAIRYHSEKGWHISESTKKEKPNLSNEIEKSTVNGIPLFKHLNKHWGKPKAGKVLSGFKADDTDMKPAHAYMKDHDVHVIHIHDRGTYRAGKSHKNDVHSTGLPVLKGTGHFQVSTERSGGGQNEQGTGMQVNFRAHPKSVEPSTHNISTKEGLYKVLENMRGKK